MSETNVKTVKKIKKVVDNFNTEVNICNAEFVGMGAVKENYTTNPIAVKKVKKVTITKLGDVIECAFQF